MTSSAAPSKTLEPSDGATAGYTTVPSIPLYVSLARAQRAVEKHGLVPDLPDIVGPMYFTGTEPEAGTRVRVGSTVEILGGDG